MTDIPRFVFLSGNAHKIAEVQQVFDTIGKKVHGIKVDHMPEEIQGSQQDVVRDKLIQAIDLGFRQGLVSEGDVVLAEDSGLAVEIFNDMPGPYTKHFFDTEKGGVSYDDFVEYLNKIGNTQVQGKTILGVCHDISSPESIDFYTGIVYGNLVARRDNKGFGWDPYFLAYDSNDDDLSDVNPEKKTFGEMDITEKNLYSWRSIAFRQYLKSLS